MDPAENELLTKVGPGTPAGDTLRKYWLPVGLSSEINSEAPKLVRWLGEDLLLFRDEFGRVGLTEPTCPPRDRNQLIKTLTKLRLSAIGLLQAKYFF